MNICLIGNGLTNILLAKNLVRKKIKVDLFYRKKILDNTSVRTIGITRENLKFLKKNIFDIEKISWSINQIKVFNETNQSDEILNFSSINESRFSIVKNHQIYNLILKSLKKEKNFSKKIINKKSFYSSIICNKKYDLIINSELNNEISKNFFFNKINKKYYSLAYTTIINHQNCENRTATQIFTNIGPIAFLPISKTETSIVFSILGDESSINENKIRDLIIKYNNNYKIKSFNKFEKFNLKFCSLRKYYHNNILSFGDNLHQIHPLAGQGFNMTIRDIKVLSKLIDEKLELGLSLDSSILKMFEKKTKHLNFIFGFGIDFIHEFFKFDNKLGNNYSKKIFKLLGKNKFFNDYINKFSDRGLAI
tara:strand:- start:809 stop:1903 length:1095 start_codon:yes stop_codon:yes gene_type:complete